MPQTLERVKKFLQDFQKKFCDQMTKLDSEKTFFVDPWEKPAKDQLHGFGISCALENGKAFEKGGANFSYVSGNSLPPSATANRPYLAGGAFTATGISIVMHPQNPYAPTSHANVRYFETQTLEGKTHGWFGGGFDLTPYYGFEEDCIEWHQAAKAACDPYDAKAYAKFKKWADDYFYLKHRDEQRGIGGIFYDDLQKPDFEKCFVFTQNVAEAYLQAYEEIVKRRKDHPFTQRERDFQLYRRGRYVEFNLLYDRGTLFGIQSGGRAESILMSLPSPVIWRYDWSAASGTPEARLTEYFLKPKAWVKL